MKNIYLLAAILVVSLGLGACSQQAEAPVSVDPANLAADIDVKTAAAVKDLPDVVMLDVREQNEYDAGHIPGVTLIPLSEVANRLSEIPTDKTVIVTCHSGNRSSQVSEFLRQNGYKNIHNMKGGIVAWENAGLPVEE